MGCCQSVPRDASAPPSPRPAHLDVIHTDSASSRASPNRTGNQQASATPRNPTSAPSSPRSRIAPRSPLPLAQPFNAPLRAHQWTGTHKATRAHAADGAASARQAWTRRSLEREREAFFDTRVTGQPEVWATLRATAEMVRAGDVDTAQGVIDASEVTVPTGDLVDGAYDSRGAYYQMLEWVIADPAGVVEDEDGEAVKDSSAFGRRDAGSNEKEEDDEEEARKEAKGKAVLRNSETFEVRARLSDRGGPGADVAVRLGKDDNVRVLTRRIKEEAGLPQERTLRIAYMGKLLKENESLRSQGYRTGHMVNALVSEAS